MVACSSEKVIISVSNHHLPPLNKDAGNKNKPTDGIFLAFAPGHWPPHAVYIGIAAASPVLPFV